MEPVYVRHIPRLIRDRWIQILDTKDGNRVITAIEILSPGNKAAGKLNRRYRRKLERYTEAGVNIVEIDLLRSSRKRLEVRTEELPPGQANHVAGRVPVVPVQRVRVSRARLMLQFESAPNLACADHMVARSDKAAARRLALRDHSATRPPRATFGSRKRKAAGRRYAR